MLSNKTVFITKPVAVLLVTIFAIFALGLIGLQPKPVYAHTYTTTDPFDPAFAACLSVSDPEHISETVTGPVTFFVCRHASLEPVTEFSNVDDPVESTFGTLGGIITKALPFVFGFAALIALLFLIWGGFRYMTAQGDEKMIAEARQTITSAIIGLVIILAVVALAQILETVFRINIIG